MLKQTILTFVFLCQLLVMKGQILHYGFDNCDGTSTGTTNFPATLVGNPSCTCGVEGNSVLLDGVNHAIHLPDTLYSYMQEDFTIDFYFQLNNTTGVSSLLSFRNQCSADSFISVKYIQQTNSLLFEMGINRGVYYSSNHNLSDYCWHRLSLVKFKLDYTFFIDNEEVLTFNAVEKIPFSFYTKMDIGNSPCSNNSVSKFSGRIDELKIYNEALSNSTLRGQYLHPGRLVSQDTTLFLGQSVQMDFGVSCSNTFTWSPAEGLDDDSISDPIASPEQTTTYTIKTNEFNCMDESKVTVYVVDADNLNCKDLLLPNAFTPNGDFLNDVYSISNTFIIESLNYFDIIDRWGNVLYHTNDAYAGWDGTFLKQNCAPGVYYVRVSYRCKNEEFKVINNFVLIR